MSISSKKARYIGWFLLVFMLIFFVYVILIRYVKKTIITELENADNVLFVANIAQEAELSTEEIDELAKMIKNSTLTIQLRRVKIDPSYCFIFGDYEISFEPDVQFKIVGKNGIWKYNIDYRTNDSLVLFCQKLKNRCIRMK